MFTNKFTKKIIFDNLNMEYDILEKIIEAFYAKHLGGNLIIQTSNGQTRKIRISDFFGFGFTGINTVLLLNDEKKQIGCIVKYGVVIKIMALIFLIPFCYFVNYSIINRVFDFTFFFLVCALEIGVYGVLIILYVIEKKRRINLLKKCCYNSDAKF